MFKKVYLLISFMVVVLSANAQLDTAFWFVAPDAADGHASGFPSRLVFTAQDDTAYVTIEMPQNPDFATYFPTREIMVPKHSTRYFYFETLAKQHIIENQYRNDLSIIGANVKGIHIRARQFPLSVDPEGKSKVYIFANYELLTGGVSSVTYNADGTVKTITTGAQNNPEIYTLLGSNALGTEFYSVFQTDKENYTDNTAKYRSPNEITSAIDIVFTDPNPTYITITLPKGKFMYNNGGVPFGSYTSETTLTNIGPFYQGQTYRIVPARKYSTTMPYSVGDRFGRSKFDRLRGVHIHSNNKIAVSLTDDSMYESGSYNIGGDMLPPVNVIGTEYFAQIGGLTNGALENVYLTAAEDTVKIEVNGVAVGTMLHAGDSMKINITSKVYIKSSNKKKFYAMQLTGTGNELGLAILPTIETCTGSTSVAFSRSVTGPMHLLVLCRAGAEGAFTIKDEFENVVFTPNPTLFQNVYTGSPWKFQKITFTDESIFVVGKGYTIENLTDVFHLGFINGGTLGSPTSGGTRYGYFSNFNKTVIEAIITESGDVSNTICAGQKAQIRAQGGRFYKWTPTDYLSDPYIRNPFAYPPSGTTIPYEADVTGFCGETGKAFATVEVLPEVKANLVLDTVSGCDPVLLTLKNKSVGVSHFNLNYGDGSSSLDSVFVDGSGDDTNIPLLNLTHLHTYNAVNGSDNASNYKIRLKVENIQGCFDTISRFVTVFPKVNITSFTPTLLTTGCDSLPISFSHTTANAHNYWWDFGDNSSSHDSVQTHLFRNLTDVIQTYQTRFIATSKFNCADTAFASVKVYPHIKAGFTVDSAQQCAPATINIYNNSLGGNAIKSYAWDFGDGSPIVNVEDPSAKAYDNTGALHNDTTIQLIIGNGLATCADTISRSIRVFPRVTADFTPGSASKCDSLPISFVSDTTNKDLSLNHIWDFGDGSSSSLADVDHTFSNSTYNSIAYTTTHTVISGNYNCRATSLPKTYTVGGKIEARFDIENGQVCADALLKFTNNSKGTITNYEWDFDGSGGIPDANYSASTFDQPYINGGTTTLKYKPSLTVRNGICFDTYSHPDSISIFPKVSAAFIPTKTEICNLETITFNRSVITPASKYFIWDFGDGTTSGVSNAVSHQFKHLLAKNDTFKVSLTAASDNCSDTKTVDIITHAYIKAAFANDKGHVCSGDSINFTNSSLGLAAHNWWIWGDGDTILNINTAPVWHPYNNTTAGVLHPSIKLLVKNDFNCFDSLERTISVYPAVFANFDTTNTNTPACNPHTVLINNLPDPNGIAKKFNWDFGDGTSSVVKNPLQHIFTNLESTEKTYWIKYTATSDSACTASDSIEIKTFAFIKADFSNDKSGVCSGNEIAVLNMSEGEVSFSKWNWGDNVSTGFQIGKPAVSPHLYDNILADTVELKTIKLTIKNQGGCLDSTTKTIAVYPAVAVDFVVDSAGSCNLDTITFTNNTKKPATKFNWDFGDGTSSAEEQPGFHVYTNLDSLDKKHWLKLTAVSDSMCKAADSIEISTYAFIKADFKLEKASVCPGTELKITNASSPAAIDSSFWDFNKNGLFVLDGNANFTHSYSNNNPVADTVQIKLKVKNLHACFDSIVRDVIIFPKVTADFEKDTSICNNDTLTFINKSVAPATSFSWDFKDGSSSKLFEPKHLFENKDDSTRTFFVKLRAFSDDKCFHDTIHTIKVYSFINADFKIDKSDVCPGNSVIITDNSPAGVTHREWDFDGNGIFDPKDTLSGTFPWPYYNSSDSTRIDSIVLKVNNGKCYDRVSAPIFVRPDVVASFSASRPDICNGESITFTDATGVNAKWLNWDFGNGTTSSITNPTVVYSHNKSAPQPYNITLTAISPYLCWSDSVYQITVHSFIEADFKIPNTNVCSGVPVEVTDVSKGGVVKKYWDFESDGIIDATSKPLSFPYPYTNPGAGKKDYKMKLIVENESNRCKDSVFRNITVFPEVKADFTFDTAGCHPFSTKFNAKDSSKNAADYNWTFSNGGTSADSILTRQFNNFDAVDKTYDVNLVVRSKDNCYDTSATKKVYVRHKPKARIGIDKTEACPPFKPLIQNASVSSKSTYYWNSGDNHNDVFTDKTAFEHIYNIDSLRTINKNYTLKLRAETEYGCKDSTSLQITVYPKVTAQFDSVAPGCNPLPAILNSSSRNAVDYVWNFGDGITSNQDTVQHLFNNSGIADKPFDVSLKAISSKGCTDEKHQTILVYPAPVASIFATRLLQTYDPDSIFTFIDATNRGPWKYTWDFGNGMVEERSPVDKFDYTYSHWGKFRVKLIAQNELRPGCADTTFQDIELLAPRPVAIFNTAVKECAPVTIRFDGSKSKWQSSYHWDFGSSNGKDTSNKAMPVKTYIDPGIYFVRLHVEGEGGQDTRYDTVTVYPKPNANFDVQPQLVMIPDDYIKCFNLTSLADRYHWDFGDGDTSSLPTPTHYYEKVGVYTMKLTVWTNNGCSDSLERTNFVQVSGKGKLVFPNAFTPNMSGPEGGKYDLNSTDNNIFFPYHEGVAEYYLEIYNRWGELLFSSNTVETGWDGYYKGKLVKQDVYVYKVRGKYFNGKTFVKAGDLTVLHKDF